MDEEYGTVTEPSTFRMVRVLPGPIERVWAYCTESEKRGKWLASGPLELRVGGKGLFTFDHSKLSPTHEATPEQYREKMKVQLEVTVIRCEPPHVLVMDWNMQGDESEVTFELTQRGSDVSLVVTHRRLSSRAMLLGISGGWHTHLGILLDRLYDRPIRPFWSSHEKMLKEYEQRIPE